MSVSSLAAETAAVKISIREPMLHMTLCRGKILTNMDTVVPGSTTLKPSQFDGKSCGEDQQRRPDSLDIQNTHNGTESRGKVEDTGGVEGLARSLDYVEGIEDLENVEALDCIDGFDFIDSFVVVDSGNNTKSVRGSAANPSSLLRHREDRQPKSDHATPASSQARASDRDGLNRAEIRSRPPQDNFCWKSQGHAEGKEARGAVMRRCQSRNGHASFTGCEAALDRRHDSCLAHRALSFIFQVLNSR